MDGSADGALPDYHCDRSLSDVVNKKSVQHTNIVALAIMVVAAGLIILDRSGVWPAIAGSTEILYRWGVILSAAAILLGICSVGVLHIRQIVAGEKFWLHSAALVAAMLAVLVAGILNPTGIKNPFVQWIFDAIIAPGQATLMALLVFFMASAAFLYFRVDRKGGGWMLFGALLMLTAQTPVARVWMTPSIGNLAAWALAVPGMAAMPY